MTAFSVIINTKNEEKNIARAIASVKKLADEIVVVDMESTDKTVKIAKANGAKVYNHKNVDYVEPARNFAISKAKNEWIFILDADEEVPVTLIDEIKRRVGESVADYYLIPRKNIVFGKWMKHSRWWPDYNVRLFRKGFVKWNDEIHSVPLTTGVGGEMEIKERFAIVHHNYSSVEQFLERMNRYTSLQAKFKIKSGYEFNWRDLIHKPLGEFLSRYFVGEGYKDGVHGIAMASLQACSELVLYLKIWQMNKFKQERLDRREILEEMVEANRERSYWISEIKILNGARLTERVRRIVLSILQ